MELLAPAGNVSALKAAVYAGCDAVYLGLDAFNARAKADNFTCENIKQYIDFCHLYGVKVYIAFNTAIKNNEMPLLRAKVNAAALAGADAFIVTDLGALKVFYDSKVPLHASTQMGIHNLEGALAAKELGFKRVVLSRECRLDDIASIKKSGLEVEVFVHGALCVSFSGGCLMSSFMSGDSGNRGRCNQPCRFKYKCGGIDDYFLSPSDLCRLSDLDKLKSVGVDSCKIEGRLKTPYYVGETVAAYAKALRGGSIDEQDYSHLKRAFNRGGFTRGYDYGNGKSIMSVKVPNNCGEDIGVIIAKRKGYIDVKTSSDISVGDGIKITRKEEEIGGMQVDKIVDILGGVRISCNNGLYNVGDRVAITYDKSNCDEVSGKIKYIDFDAKFVACAGDVARLTVRALSEEVSVESEVKIEQAVNQPTDKSDVEAILNKDCGEFKLRRAEVVIEGNCFVPKSLINSLRKKSIELLKDKILNKYNSTHLLRVDYSSYAERVKADNAASYAKEINRITVMSDNIDTLSCIAEKGGNCVLRINDFKTVNFSNIIKNGLFKNNSRIFLSVPKILRLADMQVFKSFLDNYGSYFYGLYCDNIGAVYLARQYGKKVFGGFGLNIYNCDCINILKLDYYCASCELNAAELRSFTSPYIYAYGQPVLMTLSHCPSQLVFGGSCGDCKYKEGMSYSDKYGAYPIRRLRVKDCYFDILNPDKVALNRYDQALAKSSNYFLDMVEYDYNASARVYDAFIKGNNIVGSSGHLNRGVK